MSDAGIVKDIKGKLDRSVVLTGMMGAGKTHLGRSLARVLGLEFIDSDSVIESRAGKTVADIFAQDGEAAFRQTESDVIAEILSASPCILSTGGGAVTDPGTREIIRNKAFSVWVQASLEDMRERVSRNNRRPLLQTADPAAILTDLLEKRRDLYAQADITVMNRNGSAPDAVQEILSGLAKALKIPE